MQPEGATPLISLMLLFFHVLLTVGKRDSWYKAHPTVPVDHITERSSSDDYVEWNNGALSFILSALSDQLVEEMQNDLDEDEALTEKQQRILRRKLKGIYAHLKQHPALMERRLYIGSTKPETELSNTAKRGYPLDGIERPVCPSVTEWKNLSVAVAMNNTLVEVYQPGGASSSGTGFMQWFYTVECNNRVFRRQRGCPGCCIGTDHLRYKSSCKQKKTYVMALVRSPRQRKFDWNWIQLNTSCNCAIVNKTSRRSPFSNL